MDAEDDEVTQLADEGPEPPDFRRLWRECTIAHREWAEARELRLAAEKDATHSSQTGYFRKQEEDAWRKVQTTRDAVWKAMLDIPPR
jgi:hypothetical protein